MRNPLLKILVGTKTRGMYCSLTNDTMNIIGKFIVGVKFFGRDQNILEQDNDSAQR